MRTMAAAKFKATCLAVMDDVASKREPVLVTKNGRPVAKMVPLDLAEGEDPLDVFFIGGVVVVGDIMSPLYTDEENETFLEAESANLR